MFDKHCLFYLNFSSNIQTNGRTSLRNQWMMISYWLFQAITWFQNRRVRLKRDMEEMRKDVECTTHVIPSGFGHAGHPHQMAAAAAVAASVLASRNAAAAAVAVSKYNSALDLHRSPPPPGLVLHPATIAAAAALGRSEGAESSASLMSLRSPPVAADIWWGWPAWPKPLGMTWVLHSTSFRISSIFLKKIWYKFVVHIFTLLLAPFASKLVNCLRHNESLMYVWKSTTNCCYWRKMWLICLKTHCAANDLPIWTKKVPKEA